jgi:hypothetical protein
VRRVKPKNYKKRNIQSYIEEKRRQTNWEINRKIVVAFRQKNCTEHYRNEEEKTTLKNGKVRQTN